MNEFRADLHCHTTYSDGTLTPKEIILLAKEKGLRGISITDHDSIDAYPEAIPVAVECGIELLPGVEFSTIFENNSVHVLGYAFDLNNAEIKKLSHRHQTRREDRNKAILNKLASHGMPITEEELKNCTATFQTSKRIVGRPHIALAMVQKGYVATVQDAFRLYIGEDKPDYVQGEIITLEETLSVIHGAKGLAVIAHPHLIKHESLIKKLLKMNFDGIECYYSLFYPPQNERWLKIAQQKNWIATGGSDFHGDIKPMIPLGCSWVNEETFRNLKESGKNNINH